MIFGKKFESALAWLHGKKRDAAEKEPEPLTEAPLQDSMEKGDMAAMIISAFLTIVPVVLAVLLVMVGVAWLFFSR